MKKKTKKQLKAAAERSAKIIEQIETQPRLAFRKSCALMAADLHITPQQKIEREKIMKAKKSKKAKKQVAARKTQRGIRGKSGHSVCQTWLKCFENKSLKTQKAVTKKMNTEFPKRKSAIFNYPNTVIGRANKGLLDGKSHKFAKYTD